MFLIDCVVEELVVDWCNWDVGVVDFGVLEEYVECYWIVIVLILDCDVFVVDVGLFENFVCCGCLIVYGENVDLIVDWFVLFLFLWCWCVLVVNVDDDVVVLC